MNWRANTRTGFLVLRNCTREDVRIQALVLQ